MNPPENINVTEATSKDIFNLPVTDLPVLFDLRSASAYRTSHIMGAISLPICEILTSSSGSLQQALHEAFQDRSYDSYRQIVAYHDINNAHIDAFVEHLSRYGLPLGADIGDVKYPQSIVVMRQGYEETFAQQFPFLVVRNTEEPFSEGDDIFYPSLIDETWGLYLGSFLHAKTEQVLINLNIDVVLNVTVECANCFQDKPLRSVARSDETDKQPQTYSGKTIEYHRFLAVDDPQQSMEDYWLQAADILRKCKQNQQRVLVHCAKGASRSASTVMFYLMKYEGCSFEHALRYLKQCRAVVQPNEGFIKQLQLHRF